MKRLLNLNNNFKKYILQKVFFAISFFLFINFANSQNVQVNLVDKVGQVVETQYFAQHGRESGDVGIRMKLNWFCLSKKLFSGLTCDFINQKTPNENVARNNTQPNTNQNVNLNTPNVFAQQVAAQANTQMTTQVSDANNAKPQVIYQVIEKAVPGPQGPAGRDGVDYYGPNQNNLAYNSSNTNTNNSNSQSTFLSQYSSSPTYAAQYIGFGAGNNASGDANLNSIVGAGLAGCNSSTQKILYNSTTKLFECGTDLNAGGSAFSGGDISAQNIFATTTIRTPIFYASTTNASTSNSINNNSTNLISTNATISFATFTNIFATNASFTQATTTNFYSNILSALTTYLTNLIFTNATGTNATTTNFATTNLSATSQYISGFSVIPSLYGTNATFTYATATNLYSNIFLVDNLNSTNSTNTNSTSSNLYAHNFNTINASNTNLLADRATFSYATVTHGFFTNLSVTGPVQAALNNGFIFRGGTTNISEATSTVFVANNSFVGIATTTPYKNFSVTGDAYISGQIWAPNATSLAVTNGGSNERTLCIDKVSGQIKIDTAGDCFNFMNTNFSDINLKKNVATVTNVLEKVRQINTVNFNWIDEGRGTTTQLGYIAQDVEKVFPEVVVKDDSGYLKLNYMSLSAIYANAIKELDKLVNENTNKILEIINRLTKTEEEILNLKTRVQNLENAANITVPVVAPVTTETLPETIPVLPEEGNLEGNLPENGGQQIETLP